ncbi:hypothetical protein DEU56DRAFT_692862, partial [Suillus clintonianus]|uniref:uncharacterized protein n=1 Tax=Suillus clintonianus TaxID=1904413 RepID=UPI001B880A5D
MPRILNDPNLNICPDYATPPYANARAQLINEHINEEQAIQILKNIWEASNNVEKGLCQGQVEDEREHREHLNQLQQEQQDRHEQEQIEEAELARKEEKKKYKHKYAPIQATGVPDEPSINPSPYATRKLEKGEYVELWYFTNDGLDEALIKKTIEDDTMVLLTLQDSSTAWVSAASARNTTSVINNEDIAFEDFCQACPRFISAI